MFYFIINLFFYSNILNIIQNTCEHTLLYNYTLKPGNVIYKNQIDTFPDSNKIVIEICNNNLDDDNDGLIDDFDPDCPCNKAKYHTQCPPECEMLPDSFPKIEAKIKWVSEHGISKNTIPLSYHYASTLCISDSFLYTNGTEKLVDSFSNFIQIINTKNGKNIEKIMFTNHLGPYPFTSAINKKNAQSREKILTKYLKGITYYEKDKIIWENNIISNDFRTLFPYFSDINGDGMAEIIYGNYIINSLNGQLLLHTGGSAGCNATSNFNNCSGAHSVVGDFTDHPGLELACGNKLYLPVFNNLNDSIGNRFTSITAPDPVNDGHTVMADMNGDGKLDIIVQKDNFQNDGGLWVWDPREVKILATIFTNEIIPNKGGIPVIADIIGNCTPEIVIAYSQELVVYLFDGNQFLHKLYSIKTTDTSGLNRATVFDLNGDGIQEIIYRDETHLRIFDGPTGLTLYQTDLLHGTAREIPIITDVDDDGHAEIIIDGTMPGDTMNRIYCFESATEPWMPARKIWNQSSYHVTNVNDDMTIPSVPQNTAAFFDTDSCFTEICPQVYNTFNVQATYRTQKGCVVRPEFSRDLTVNATAQCLGDCLEICIILSANDTNVIRQGVPVTCFAPPWDNLTDDILDQIIVTRDTTCMKIPRMAGLDSIMIVANYEGPIYPAYFKDAPIRECDYTNNEFVLYTGDTDFTLEVVSYVCTPDSMTFTLVTDNVGRAANEGCVSLGYYFLPPDGFTTAAGLFEHCFDWDASNQTFRYRDTIEVTIPIPTGQNTIWWTINDSGFGPGFGSSGISECTWDNNMGSIYFDITPLTLDLGPDVVKCSTEVISLDAGTGFSSYSWSDFSSDPVFSTASSGLHYLVATDQCGREYRDSVLVTIDTSKDIDIGEDILLCPNEKASLSIDRDFDQIYWLPGSGVSCDTCRNVIIEDIQVSQVVVRGENGECVSFDTLQINRKPVIEISDMITLCQGESYTLGDSTWQHSGTYIFPLNDCDSILFLQLETIPSDTIPILRSICANDSLLFFNEYLHETGLYSFTTQGYRGCDSTILLTLTVSDTILQQDTFRICEGDSVLIFNQWVFTDKTLREDGLSVAGCDSTTMVTVQLIPLPQRTRDITLCQGDSVLVYNTWLTEAGQYPFRIQQNGGCDSIVEVRLTLSDRYEVLDSITLCPGDSVLVFGDWVREAGVFEENRQTVSGCDSLIRIEVNKIIPPQAPEVSVDCEEEEIIASISAGASYLIEWDNGDTSRMTRYTEGDSARVTWISEPHCQGMFSIVLPELPVRSSLDLPEDAVLANVQPINISLDLDPNQWAISWSPAIYFTCDSCAQTVLSPTGDVDIVLTLTHISGCVYSHSFRVTFQKQNEEWFIPNIIKPGSIGGNNYWKIQAPSHVTITRCRVYDRWSDLVYKAESGEAISWDGLFQGQEVVPGVYVYVIEWMDHEGNKKVTRGDMTVIR